MRLTERAARPEGAAAYESAGAWDEAFFAAGDPREDYGPLMAALGGHDLDLLRAEVTAQLAADGVAFGAGPDVLPFVVDAIPRLLGAAEWARLEAGLAQRVRALDAWVADVYDERRALGAGIVPERVLTGIAFLEPDLRDLPPINGAHISVAGLDVVRDVNGEFAVLEDNVRTPSGMAYALAARRSVTAHLPWDGPRRDPRAEIADGLGRALEATRPPGEDGVAVLLSDGPSNTAWWEHQALASLAGVPLVVPSQLRIRGDHLCLRDGDRPVSALYRRTDGDRLRGDDGELTPIGELLLGPLRAGTLGLVNRFGTGVADDKRVYPYVDELVRFYIGEEPLVPSVACFDLAEPGIREQALDRIDELVLKPRDGHGGHGVLIGPNASATELRDAAAQVRADPEGWIAQELVILSTHPTIVDGRLAPRHVDLRPFVLFDGTDVRAIPGGLTRFALIEGEMVVNSSRGGGAKDTWVAP